MRLKNLDSARGLPRSNLLRACCSGDQPAYGNFRELVGSHRQIVTFTQLGTVSWFQKSVVLTET